MNHPGTANLYDMSLPVAEGGLTFRARFGVERDGDNLLAEGVFTPGSEIEDGYPEFTMQMLMDLGWDGDLTSDERAAIDAVAGEKTNWKTDLVGRHPACCDCPWLCAIWQRQSACCSLDLPRSSADTPRAALYQPPRSGG